MSNKGYTSKFTFANQNIPASDKDKVKKWVSDNLPDYLEYFTNLCDSGYRLSVKYDLNNDCFVASATGFDCIKDNQNVILTARASNPVEATMILFYKHFVWFDADVWQVDDVMDTWG